RAAIPLTLILSPGGEMKSRAAHARRLLSPWGRGQPALRSAAYSAEAAAAKAGPQAREAEGEGCRSKLKTCSELVIHLLVQTKPRLPTGSPNCFSSHTILLPLVPSRTPRSKMAKCFGREKAVDDARGSRDSSPQTV